MNIAAVFLDIDGTLVDSNEFHVIAWSRALQEAGVQVPAKTIFGQIGKGADMLLPAVAPNLHEPQRKLAAKRHGEIFRTEFLPKIKPFPRATEFVERMHGLEIKVLLASSAEQAEVDHYVRLLRIKPWLYGTTSSDDVEKSKPAGDLFATALAKVSPIAAEHTLAVGDTPYDVESASKSAIATIALRSGGFAEAVLRKAGAKAIFADVSELLDGWNQLLSETGAAPDSGS